MTRAELEHVSESVKAVNPDIFSANQSALADARPPAELLSALSRHRRGVMNKTESEYAALLKALEVRGEILRFEFEGITLRWAGMRYTPDFVIFRRDQPILFLEVKGARIWDRDLVRFKGARAFWPEFQFELHQKREGVWQRIY